MNLPVIHQKHWHGMWRHALAASGLWLSAACGEVTATDQEPMEGAGTPASVDARRQAVVESSCSPDTTPPVVTCAATAVAECGTHVTSYHAEPEPEVSDNCEIYGVWAEPIYASVGTQYTYISVRDMSGNSASCATKWTILDTESPVIDLAGPTEMTLALGEPYAEPGYSANDFCENYGGLFPVTISGSVNSQVPGTYVLTYKATDRSGNTDIKTRTVKVLATQPVSVLTGNTTQSRLRHTATPLSNGRVLVVGGYSRNAEEYNPGTRTWSAVGAPFAAHRGHTASRLPDGRVLVAGGAKSGSASVEELYDPAQGQWSRTGLMSTVRYDHAAVTLYNGKVLVAGGSTSEGSGPVLATAELYDPATGQWSATAPLNTARRNHTLSLLPDGLVVAAGGVGADGVPLSSVEYYDALYARWLPAPSMSTGRTAHTATVLDNGNLLIVGGLTQDPSLGATAELLDRSGSSRWFPAGSMAIARRDHTATLVRGKVLVTGGYNSQTGIQYSSELYDPKTGWSGFSASLNEDRYKHTATQLDANTVLLVGGFSNRDPSATTAELYTFP
ncbi:kelch repeat-containing protein [Cystobacter ferrugineus]|nr:kelch repeat-containing protein [Cystobacter ferrugineus]